MKRLWTRMSSSGAKKKSYTFNPLQEELPPIVEACVSFLEERGLHTPGIFRESAETNKVALLIKGFRKGSLVAWKKQQDPHLVAAVLKVWLCDLDAPLLTDELQDAFIAAHGASSQDRMLYRMAMVVQLLPPANRMIFERLVRLLTLIVENQRVNQMDSRNLAIIFAPILLRAKNCNNLRDILVYSESSVGLVGVCIRHYQQIFHPDPALIDKQQLDQRMATLGFGRKVKKGGLELIKKMIAEEAALEDDVAQNSLAAEPSSLDGVQEAEEPSRVRFEESPVEEEAPDVSEEDYDSDELTQAQAKLRDMFKASPTLYADPEMEGTNEATKEEQEEDEGETQEGNVGTMSESEISTPVLRRRVESVVEHDIEASRVTLSPAQNQEDLTQLLSSLSTDLDACLSLDSALATELGIDAIEAKLRQMELQEATLLQSMETPSSWMTGGGGGEEEGEGSSYSPYGAAEDAPLQLDLSHVVSEEMDKEELTVRAHPSTASPSLMPLESDPLDASFLPALSPPRFEEPAPPTDPPLAVAPPSSAVSPRANTEAAAETLAVLIESTAQSKLEEERKAAAEQEENERIRRAMEAETQRTQERLAEETKRRLAEEEAKCKASLEQLQALEDARIQQEHELARQRREREAQQEEQWKARQRKLQEQLRASPAPSSPAPPSPTPVPSDASGQVAQPPEEGVQQRQLDRRKEQLAQKKRQIREKRKSLGQVSLVQVVEATLKEETKSQESDLLAQRRKELSERKAQLQQRSRQLSEKSLVSQKLMPTRAATTNDPTTPQPNEQVQERKKILLEQQKEVDTLRRKHEEEGQSLTSALQEGEKESAARLLLAEEQKRVQALIQQRKEALRKQKALLLEKQRKEQREREEQEEHLSFMSDSATTRPLSPQEQEERQTAYLQRIIQETSINVDSLIEDVQNTIYSPNPARRVAAIQEATAPRVNSMRLPGGAFYTGPVKEGKGEGHGRIRYPDGGLYEGNVIAGFRHGLGTMIYSNGDRYVGHWDDDQPHGAGSYIPQEGEPHEGEWQHGQRM